MNQPLSLPLGPVMLDIKATKLDKDDVSRLSHPMTGGVILFSKNFNSKKQVIELIGSIKVLRTPQLLVCVDQEGGRVQRFTQGFTRLPAAAEIGDIYDKSRRDGALAASAAGELMAAELAETGIDFSFAPVLDVRSCESDVIGNRSFHDRAEVVAELAGAYIDGMNAAGMAATGKHFPGHGGVELDSHHELPRDVRSLPELASCDLVPFSALINDLAGVMTAHVLFDTIEAEIPTFSSYWLREQLRTELGFDGVIFSDDLAMEGAKQGGIVSCANRALTAGCDMTLICNSPDTADELLDGLLSGDTRALANEALTSHLGRMRLRAGGTNRAYKAKEILRSLDLID
jgi:beta-N-acetylhexosaminidase